MTNNSMHCPVGGECPRECPRTQPGCFNIWGSDAQYLEAVARNIIWDKENER